MTIPTTCPGCGTACTVADEFQGKKVRCPKCKEVFGIGLSVLGVISYFLVVPLWSRLTSNMTPPAPATGAVQSDAELTEVLDALKAPDPAGRARAAERLLKTEPNIPRRAEVAQLLAER